MLTVYTFTLESLLEKSKEKYSTIVTEYPRSPISVDRENMRTDDIIILLLGVG